MAGCEFRGVLLWYRLLVTQEGSTLLYCGGYSCRVPSLYNTELQVKGSLDGTPQMTSKLLVSYLGDLLVLYNAPRSVV